MYQVIDVTFWEQVLYTIVNMAWCLSSRQHDCPISVHLWPWTHFFWTEDLRNFMTYKSYIVVYVYVWKMRIERAFRCFSLCFFILFVALLILLFVLGNEVSKYVKHFNMYFENEYFYITNINDFSIIWGLYFLCRSLEFGQTWMIKLPKVRYEVISHVHVCQWECMLS